MRSVRRPARPGRRASRMASGCPAVPRATSSSSASPMAWRDHARLVDGDWPPAEPDADGTLDGRGLRGRRAAGSVSRSVERLTRPGQRRRRRAGAGPHRRPLRAARSGAIRIWFADALALDGAQSSRRLHDARAADHRSGAPARSRDRHLGHAALASRTRSHRPRSTDDRRRRWRHGGARAASGCRPRSQGRRRRDDRSAGHPRPCDGRDAVERQRHPAPRRPGHRARRLRADHGRGHGRRASAGHDLGAAGARRDDGCSFCDWPPPRRSCSWCQPSCVAPVLATGCSSGWARSAPPEAVVVAPRLTAEALLLAAIAAGMAVIGMAIPIVASSGPIAAVRRSVGRQLSRTAAHRTGLDLAFVAFAAIVLWELRANGAPIAASFRGTSASIRCWSRRRPSGLAAGAVLTMRVVPSPGRAAWSASPAVARGSSGRWRRARSRRRSSRYSRSALLLVVAVAIAFLAATLRPHVAPVAARPGLDGGRRSTSWPRRARGSPTAGGLQGRGDAPPSVVAARADLLAEAGITAADPIVAQPFDLRRPNGRGTMLALVPELAAAIVDLRTDLAERPFADQLRPWSTRGPSLSTLALPADAARLRASRGIERPRARPSRPVVHRTRRRPPRR